MQASEVVRGVGNGDLIGKVAHHRGDDPVAGFLFVACGFDETRRGTVRGVGAIPYFRPAKNGQRRPGQTTFCRFDQIKLPRPVFVGLIACGAEFKRDCDVAIERQKPLLKFVGLFDDFQRVTGVAFVKRVPDQKTTSQGSNQCQGDTYHQSFFCTGFSHCHLSQNPPSRGRRTAFAIRRERGAGRRI